MSKNNRLHELESSVTAHAVLYLRPQADEGLLGRALRREGFTVHYVRRAALLRHTCSTLRCQALIADPGMGAELRDLPQAVRPRVCLSLGDGVSASHSGIFSLPAGAQPHEVIARLRALLRRARGYPAQYRVGALGIDVLRGRASLSGKPLRLQPRELRALTVLACRPWEAVPTARLAEALHPGAPVCPSLVPTYIGRLRRRLGTHFIETLPGIGYRLTPPDQVPQ